MLRGALSAGVRLTNARPVSCRRHRGDRARPWAAIINDDPFERDVSITPGRNYRSDVKDYGLSGEVVYDLGGAELTSITAYRYNKYIRGQDADFNNLDILYRDDDGGAFNRFKTFTQELRLQGEAFDGRLDWLVGGYYANEKLRVDDNLAYGDDYSRYANCLVAANFAAAAPTILAPGVSPNCFNPLVAGGVRGALVGNIMRPSARGSSPPQPISPARSPRSARSLSSTTPAFRPAFRRSTSARRAVRRPVALPISPSLLGGPSSRQHTQRPALDDTYQQRATTGRCSPTISSTSPTR